MHRCFSRAHCHGLGQSSSEPSASLVLLLNQWVETFSRLSPHCQLLGTPNSDCSGSLFKIQGSRLSSKSLKLQALALANLVELLLDSDKYLIPGKNLGMALGVCYLSSESREISRYGFAGQSDEEKKWTSKVQWETLSQNVESRKGSR